MTWGTAHVEAHRNLRAKILANPFVRIIRESLTDTEVYLLLVASPLLSPGYHGQRELVIDDSPVRFKPWVEA
jgi:hypothetical protein